MGAIGAIGATGAIGAIGAMGRGIGTMRTKEAAGPWGHREQGRSGHGAMRTVGTMGDHVATGAMAP